MTDPVVGRIRSFIASELLFDEARDAELGVDEPLLGSGVLDSMGVLKLAAFLEQEFGVEIEDLDMVPANFDSLQCMRALVDRKRGASGS